MTTGRKLAIGGVVVVGVTAYMAYVGASTSWQYYLSVDECLAANDIRPGDRIRVSGKVAPGSLQIAAGRSEATFSLLGARANLQVICRGPLPDNLAEEIDVVVQGRLQESGLLQGEKLITRCASKYESQESARAEGKP